MMMRLRALRDHRKKRKRDDDGTTSNLSCHRTTTETETSLIERQNYRQDRQLMKS